MGELTDHLRSFLAERWYAVLATQDLDGGIRLAPIWYLGSRLYFAVVVEKPAGEERRAHLLRLGRGR